MGKGTGKGVGKGKDGEGLAVGAVCLLVWLIIGCSLLGTSFDVIKPSEVGIRWNPNGYHMYYEQNGDSNKDGVWSNGRHCLAPGHSFVKFKKTIKYEDFMSNPIGVWTRDKQEIYLQCGIYYRIDPAGVVKLYKKYGEDYQQVWKKKIVEAIKSTTKYWDTVSYFTERTRILNNITSAIRYRMADEQIMNISYGEGVTVLMGSVDIPYDFEVAVTDKVVTQQEEITELMSRNYTLVLADTTIVEALADKKVSVIAAKAAASASKIVGEAETSADALKEKSYAESYAYIRDTLGLNNTQLMKYIWARNLKAQDANSKIVVNNPVTS